MRRIFSFLLFFPCLGLATMTQAEIDKLYTKPIVLSSKQYTFNVELPVDSIDGYRWFLISPDYDYIDDDSYSHESVDIQNSKWGGMDNFKLKLTKKFRKVPHKIVLHFECLRPFESNPKILTKDVTVLSLPD
ncbi:hypothetical protein [Francisella tularensis]|nr:hypothetical protein [Francisella tularensis]ACD30344.1 conserved hypothetical protein [Francisella tularensis subsp. mediasiatica FSC147]ABK89188.1 hypothetical protein FTN_0280 [Francisella tularensis subsp. novicida U112]AJI45329.1 chagasin peptidase inhibitor I42 family protein [Francisella tularensis subsp. novicida F6168]AJI61273.1 chagasin peptidase inhibitor I42 family protein [Francisella tularensis subsp. novicida U112]AJI74024.1 chagasin peptidase inhibitor I42 family protein [Fr